MKVLHIFDVAGVGVALSKLLNKSGTTSKIISRERSLNSEQADYCFSGNIKRFYLIALIKSLRYDIIHIHSLDVIIPFFRLLGKKVILHYHGTDIRGKWKSRKKLYRFASQIIVSTPDLLIESPPKTIYLPNPVLLTDKKPKKNKKALFIITDNSHYVALALARYHSRLRGLKLEIFDRRKEFIEQEEFYCYLRQFEYYMDFKEGSGYIIPALSLTALESLTFGIKVINCGVLFDTLPEQHQPKNVIDKLLSIYEAIL